MLADLLLAAAFQVGPFYEQRPDEGAFAFRPFWSREEEKTDVLWPLFTRHRDWWRFAFFVHYQEGDRDDWQFDVLPFWSNGHTAAGESYAGLFPIYGTHPHFLTLYDWEYVLWPVWMRYRRPRPATGAWLTTQAVLFPFVSWRDDGAWGVWPFYGVNYQRESEHRYALWPLVTWADYREDRDTSGAGSSWMVWPFWASVDRARERQTMFLPPLFSWTETADGWRLRCPWPLVEVERMRKRARTSVFPLWEHEELFEYRDGKSYGDTYRIGWRFIEILPDETRVFPFWKRNDRHFRLWPFYEEKTEKDVTRRSALALFPISWADSVERNWAAFWTFYRAEANPVCTDHELFWGLFRWRTVND